jgi:sugar/nucleoside kinase (ribokinase family)
MSVTVVGSIAYDAVQTPHGGRERMLGGAAVHFALAASFFDEVRVVGPVGDDFGDDEYAVLHARGVNTEDIERVAGGKTFFWKGVYGQNMNSRETLETDLNVFETFDPKLSQESKDAEVLFLANIVPGLQRAVRAQSAAKWVALDSMDLWIDIMRDDLVAAIGEVDCLILNDGELQQLTGAPTTYAAAQAIFGWDAHPSAVIAKLGSYGATVFTEDGGGFTVPVFPLDTVIDPTGAGDTFAGGVVGYVAARLEADPDLKVDRDVLAAALIHGTATASHNVEAFGAEKLYELPGSEVQARVDRLVELTRVPDAQVALRA